jgi:hypothetical protein
MKNPDRALMLQILDHAFDRASWHGANLSGAIRGVSAAGAARRVGRRKTIWEQVLHAAYWKQRVLNKLVGATRFPRKGSNWPAMPDRRDDAAWRADVKLLTEIHWRLRDVVEKLPAGKVMPKGVWMIHGAAFHDVYHAGQIKLLRRLLLDADDQ